MHSADAPRDTVVLNGEWTRSNAVERHAFLATELARRVPGQRLGIDFREVTEIDACGCQLLALFIIELETAGMAPTLGVLPEDLAQHICLLGFDGTLTPRAGRETDA